MATPTDHLVTDIFRRADKNDDNALQFGEFKGFFADNVLTDDELRSIFEAIDTDHNGIIDTLELATFMASHLGDFEVVFRHSAELSAAVTAALTAMHAAGHDSAANAGTPAAFAARLFMKESGVFLMALVRQLDAAYTAVHTRAAAARSDVQPFYSTTPEPPAVAGSLSKSSSLDHSPATVTSLAAQVDRLTGLVDRLTMTAAASKVPTTHAPEEGHTAVLVTRTWHVDRVASGAAAHALLLYLRAAAAAPGCLRASEAMCAEPGHLCVHELWATDAAHDAFFQGAARRALDRALLDVLERPESRQVTTVPRHWLAL